MKKRLSILITVMAMLIIVSSCSKDGGADEGQEGKTGKLTVSFNLPTDNQAGTRAVIPVSTAKPITTWASVTRAVILFVDASNVIKDARAVSLPSTGSAPTTDTYLDVVANSTGYTAYIIGNYPTSWNISTLKGQQYTSLNITAPSATGYATSPHFDTGSTGYDEVGDVFVAKQDNVIVNADANNIHSTPFQLARINSLLRLRLDVNTNKATTRNDVIDFITANAAMFSIRRVATKYVLSGTTTYATLLSGTATSPGTYFWENGTAITKALNVFYKATAMKDANPTTATHSNPGTILTNGADYNLTLWNEYKIFPGGRTASNPPVTGEGLDKFDIVISGLTKDATYIPAGRTTAVSPGTRVYWSGQVQKAIGPNQILELSIAINSAGSTTLPETGSFGNLEIGVNLVQWGDIVPSQMEM